MKSLSRIFIRYLATAILIILCTLFFNAILFILSCHFAFHSIDFGSHISSICASLREKDGTFTIGEEERSILEEEYAWAMLLSDGGEVLWSFRLPPELDHPYTAREVAVFSKWYLKDYPVTEWVTDWGLFVAGKEKDSVWKYNISSPMEQLEAYPALLRPMILGNLLLVLSLCLLLGFSFYRSLRGVASGIEQLSEQKSIRLPERGMTEILARQLNKTSDILKEQKERLQQKDDARTTWISGVSHDIRTPLSLIMGYASTLKTEAGLTKEQRRQMELIEAQSLQIKHLIEDLNLASKLEYDMQPLRPVLIKPAILLRRIVSDFYNQGLSPCHRIDLYIDSEVELLTLQGDENLLIRAFRNLIQNSIRHNPDGCTVTITAYPDQARICFQVSDDGCGIPQEIIDALEDTAKNPQGIEGIGPEKPKAPHLMGLRIARQVFTAHGWQVKFADNRTIWIIT